MKTILRLALGSLLAGAGLSAFGAPNQLLVKYKPNSSPALINASIGAQTVRSYPEIGWQLVRLPASVTTKRAMSYFSSLSSVAKVEESVKFKPMLLPNDPLIGTTVGAAHKQYQHSQIGMPSAWDVSVGSTSTIIAIVDSGIRATHEDLKANHLASLSRNFTLGGDPLNYADDNGHGTHCAGDAGAVANNGKGGTGTAWNVRIMTCKITYGQSGTEDFADGIIYATNNGAKVINMSFGSYYNSSMLSDACTYAYNKDVVLVAAAGNDNTTNVSYPAGYAPAVLSVASTDQGSAKSGFSNYGPSVDIGAPGGQIINTSYTGDSDYEVFSGTSMASPIAVGAIALMRSYAPDLPNTEILKAVRQTAVQPATPYSKFGEINVGAAIRTLSVPVVSEAGPSTAATYEGTAVRTDTPAGHAADLDGVDGAFFEVKSSYKPTQGSLASIQADLPVVYDATKFISARLQLDLKATRRVTALVQLYNWNTNSFEMFDSYALDTTMRSVDVGLPLSSLSKYVKNGKMRIFVRTVLPSRLGASAGNLYTAQFESVKVRLVQSSR